MSSQELIKFDSASNKLICQGNWIIANFPLLKKQFKKIVLPSKKEITIDAKNIQQMDSAGAWLLGQWIRKVESQGILVSLENLSIQHEKLLVLVLEQNTSLATLPHIMKFDWISHLGKYTVEQVKEFHRFLTFVGYLTLEALRVVIKPIHFRIDAVTSVIDKCGYRALPIMALLSAMIGVVIAYQMGLQLREYGANIFIVNLLGLSILREFGPLLTAIMVAGRTGSAFTAQLGIMKLNQEIDALNTMGVTPAELLILPRMIGLLIALPLLTIWSDIFGVLGGMIMSNNMLNITWSDFLTRFQQQIPLRALFMGLGKAPVFALIIGSIGCFQGMEVRKNAESVGTRTTRSVVLAIFFIIVVDAAFSIIFSKFKL